MGKDGKRNSICLQKSYELTKDRFKAFRQWAWEYALKVKKDDSAVKANRRMFREAIKKEKKNFNHGGTEDTERTE